MDSIAMRTLFLTFSILCASVIGARSEAPKLDGAWVLSEEWAGSMGLALVVKSNEFRYWFYSDVIGPHEPAYPISGKVAFDGDLIRLLPSIANADLYAKNWHLVAYKGEICLLAESDLQGYKSGNPFPYSRLLFKIDNFDEKKPVLNKRRKRD